MEKRLGLAHFKKNKLNTLLAPLFKKFTEQYFLFIVQQSGIQGVVVVAQLEERSLPIPEVHGSNLVIGKNFILKIYRKLY